MERLQKYIASCGVASRRKAEELITATDEYAIDAMKIKG